MIITKKYQIPAIERVDKALQKQKKVHKFNPKAIIIGMIIIMILTLNGDYLGARSQPCCIKDPIVNQKLFKRLNIFSKILSSCLHGLHGFHSYGENLPVIKSIMDTPTKAANI